MVMEVMGALIVLGVLMVALVRYQSGRQQELAAEHQEIRESTAKLRKELERSGNEIIQRMGARVTQLEGLIREADEQSEMLNRRLAEVQAIRQNLQQQLVEGHVLHQQLLEQQRQCQQAYQQMEALWVRNIPTPSYAAESRPLRNVTVPSLEEPQSSFSQILRESMEGDGRISATPVDVYEPSPDARRPLQPPVDDEREELGQESSEPDAGIRLDSPVGDPVNDTAANRAKFLLSEGRSVEDVSKETGIGRGAIELLRQMVQRQEGK